MKRLYFIRHGLSELNVQGLIAGITETPLTDEGRKQAKAAGKLAKSYHVDLIVSSPMSRALETAHIIAREIGYSVDDILVHKLVLERDFGSLEGKPWSPDLNLDGIADLETDDTLIARARLALKWLQSLPADNILVVSHGGFGRGLRSAIRQESALDHEVRLANAEIHQWI